MAKANRRKTLTLLLGSLSFAVSGCVSGYVEGTEDYLKFCVERQPPPNPSKCPKQAPEGKEKLIAPYASIRIFPVEAFRGVSSRELTLDS